MVAAVLQPLLVGRYAIFDRIAAGGMAAVHIGRLAGEGGFARTVAIKRLHPQFALDPDFVAMFLDEARLAARIRHPNVVPTVDIVTSDGELFLVMEYVEGESLASLLRQSRRKEEDAPVDVVAGTLAQALQGLHAAHEARNDLGEPLGLVHRDVSPQNLLVGTDGVVRVVDFGVAKALGKLHTTREGQLKGKLGYLAPEQVLGHPVTRQSDVFAAAVVLWEALAGQRLFVAETEGRVLQSILDGVIEPPSHFAPQVPPALDRVVLRGLAREPADRFETAIAMAEAIEQATPIASTRAIGKWVGELAVETLGARATLVATIEGYTGTPSGVRRAHPNAPTLDDIVAPGEQTSIGVETEPTLPMRSRRGSWAWVALGGALLGGGAATAVLLGRVASRDTHPPAASSETVRTAAQSPVPAPIPSVTPESAPSATTTNPVGSAPSSSVPSPTAPRGSGRGGHPRTSAPAPSGLYSRE